MLSPLVDRPLRYLIGTDSYQCREGEIVEVAYDATKPEGNCIAIKYGNLFDERGTGAYGPYLHTSDTAAQYHEGQINPRGPGWEKNLREQFERARKQRFQYVELDNPDAYSVVDVVGAVDLAASYGLQVIAKNPLLMDDDPVPYVRHPNIVGAIVERGAGSPADMHALRLAASKPNLPIWYVAFGTGKAWALNVARLAREYQQMRVSYSAKGEYESSIDIP